MLLEATSVEPFSAKIERSLFKIFFLLFGFIVVLGAGGYGGVRLVRAWQERRFIAEANALVNEGQYKRASFEAQRVLQLNAQSAGANRVLAEVGERNGLRAAVDFRRRAAELSRNDVRDLLTWARTAVRFGDAASATKALESVPSPTRETAEYHALQGDLALLRRDAITCEKELSRATELQPENKTYRLALATLHLTSDDAAAHERGRAELLQLQSDETLRREVTQRLTDDALRRHEAKAAAKYARELNANPHTDFPDRLRLLSALRLAGDPDAEPLLAPMQKDAGESSAEIAALLGWMNAQGMSREAVAWIQTLPPQLFAAKTLPLIAADAFVGASDWAGLQKFLRASNWGAMEYLRVALLARASRELGHTEESAQEWNEAIAKVQARSDEIFLLAEMAQKWGWQNEALDLLWLAAQDPQKAAHTLDMLYRFYAARGDTQELYRVLLHLEELHPNDPAILNNIAQVSLLLKLNSERGHQLARQVHEANPGNTDYTSTYAFSLYLRGEPRKALQALQKMPDVELHRPQIAAYYGLVLAAVGDWEQAREFLDLGAKANLLPEERALVEKAQLAVAQR